MVSMKSLKKRTQRSVRSHQTK